MFGSSLTKLLKLDNLVDHLTGYVETKVELIKVDVRRDVSNGLAQAITYMIIVFAFIMVLLFISLGVATLLADRLGAFAGYGSVAAFYLVLGLILLSLKDAMCRKFKRILSDESTKKNQ